MNKNSSVQRGHLFCDVFYSSEIYNQLQLHSNIGQQSEL